MRPTHTRHQARAALPVLIGMAAIGLWGFADAPASNPVPAVEAGQLAERFGAPPRPLATGWRPLLGHYRQGDRELIIRQAPDGRLDLLGPGDRHRRLMPTPVPDRFWVEGERSGLVRFERDESRRPVACQIGELRWERFDFSGAEGTGFRIVPQRPLEELRLAVRTAQPPAEPGPHSRPDLVEIAAGEAGIQLDIRYASTDNFTGAPFYDAPRAFLQRPAAEAVQRAQELLADWGLGLVIHDAYRPWSVTWMFWEATPPEHRDFVANPAHGSRHNRGAAVDVSLVNRATGRPVEMPCDYDEFSPRAHPEYPGGTARARWHRDLLRATMESVGFTVYPNEWWHFDFRDWQRYPILNLPFDRIP